MNKVIKTLYNILIPSIDDDSRDKLFQSYDRLSNSLYILTNEIEYLESNPNNTKLLFYSARIKREAKEFSDAMALEP